MRIATEHRCLTSAYARVPPPYRGLLLPCETCPSGLTSRRRSRFLYFWAFSLTFAVVGLMIVRAVATFSWLDSARADRGMERFAPVDSAAVLAGLAVVGAVGIQSGLSMRSHAEMLANPTRGDARDEFQSASQHYVITLVAAGFTLLVTLWQVLEWDFVTAGAGLLLCWVLSVQATHGRLREPRELVEERRDRLVKERRVVVRRHNAIRAASRAVRYRLALPTVLGILVTTILLLLPVVGSVPVVGLTAVDLYLVGAAVVGGYFSLDVHRLWARALFFVFVTTLMGLALLAVLLEGNAALVQGWTSLAAVMTAHFASLAFLAIGLCGVGPLRGISSPLLSLKDRRMRKRWTLLPGT